MDETLLKFIEKAGQKSEIELFSKTFQSLPRMKFGVILIGLEVLRSQLETLAESIAFMNRMGIYPTLVFRLQPSDYFESAAPKVRAEKGFDPPTLKRLFTTYSNALIKEIRRKKGRATVVSDALYRDDTRRKPLRLDSARVVAAMALSQTVIISPLVKEKDKAVVVDSESICRTLLKTIKPKKCIIIHESGGIYDEDDQRIPFINLSHPKEMGPVRKDMKRFVRELRQFVSLAKGCALVVTSANALLKEIFTVRGKGTFIKAHVIQTTTSIEDLNQRKIKQVLEDAFDKKITPHYFKQKFKSIIYQKEYEGIAIVQSLNNGIPYLDKFAVGKVYEGTGLGKTLWQKVSQKYPKLVWRSRPNNSLNSFYFRECDGCLKYPEWYVFWRQLEWPEVKRAVQAVLKKKRTLVEFE